MFISRVLLVPMSEIHVSRHNQYTRLSLCDTVLRTYCVYFSAQMAHFADLFSSPMSVQVQTTVQQTTPKPGTAAGTTQPAPTANSSGGSGIIVDLPLHLCISRVQLFHEAARIADTYHTSWCTCADLDKRTMTTMQWHALSIARLALLQSLESILDLIMDPSEPVPALDGKRPSEMKDDIEPDTPKTELNEQVCAIARMMNSIMSDTAIKDTFGTLYDKDEKEVFGYLRKSNIQRLAERPYLIPLVNTTMFNLVATVRHLIRASRLVIGRMYSVAS